VRLRAALAQINVQASVAIAATSAATTRPVGAARTAATAARATKTAATATCLLRARFINRQRATIHALAVEGSDCCLGFLIGTHLDKTKAL
jgi:hypothetical protein